MPAGSRSPEHAALGRALRAARQRAGLSLKELETSTGIGFSYIAAVERGTRNASVDVVFRLCDALDVSVPRLAEDYERELETRG